MSVYVTSDLHLNDPKVLQYSKFKDLNEYNTFIITKYNEKVKKDDLVYILGDVGFTPKEKLSQLIKKMNGRKVLLIGNHDQLNDAEYREMGFIEVYRRPIYYSDNIILSHIPVQEALNNPWVYNLHGHLHQGRLSLKNYINVNFSLNNYAPCDLKWLAQEIKSPSRFEPFGEEWYSQWES